MKANRQDKIEYLKKVLSGQNTALLNRKQFEIWKGIDGSNEVFENSEKIQLSKSQIEANTASGKGAMNNIYVFRPHSETPLADSENTVIL